MSRVRGSRAETIEGLSNSQRQNEEGSRAGVAAHVIGIAVTVAGLLSVL